MSTMDVLSVCAWFSYTVFLVITQDQNPSLKDQKRGTNNGNFSIGTVLFGFCFLFLILLWMWVNCFKLKQYFESPNIPRKVTKLNENAKFIEYFSNDIRVSQINYSSNRRERNRTPDQSLNESRGGPNGI